MALRGHFFYAHTTLTDITDLTDTRPLDFMKL